MPFLDITNDDDLTRLIHLFMAAHPHCAALNDQIRAQRGGAADDYWVSTTMLREMAAWAQAQQLLRPPEAFLLLLAGDEETRAAVRRTN